MFDEFNLETKRTERLPWYQVGNFLDNMAKTQEELGVYELINIGGNAVYYWLLSTMGPSAITNFRGTEDLDMVSFSQGKFRNVLGMMQGKGYIKGWNRRSSYGFTNKQTYEIGLNELNGAGLPGELKVDMYSAKFGKVHFNDRILSSDRIILEPPVQLTENVKGIVMVPSLLDLFLFKTDIILGSNSGLRDKDKADVLAILFMGVQVGDNIDKFVGSMVDNDTVTGLSIEDTRKKLIGLQKLFKSAASAELQLGVDGTNVIKAYL